MPVTCAHCGTTLPLHDAPVHDSTCDGHSNYTPTGWTKCTHDGPCYTEAAA